jgi:hypothetical protein
MSTHDPRDLSADALILPLSEDERVLSGLLDVGASAVVAQLREYPEDREIRLTSAGMLPVRFLLHLSLPKSGVKGRALIRERLAECFHHARVLALRDLALPIALFAEATDDFAELVEAIWDGWNEDATDVMRLRLLTDENDLRSEYLRRFIQRRRGRSNADHQDKGMGISAGNLEGVLRPVLPAGVDLEQGLERLLEDYRDRRPLDDAFGLLNGPMSRAFAASLDPGEGLEDLPGILRILGPSLVQRLPWELLRDGSTFLGERFVFPRGTSFFVLGGREIEKSASFRLEILADEKQQSGLTQELHNLLHRGGASLDEGRSEEGQRSIVYASGVENWEQLLSDENPPGGELVFLERASEFEESVDAEELAGRLLARGFQRVLSPMAAFRDPREARIFRMAFFEQYFRGHGAGGALRYAQRALLEAFGLHSGWFLYRIFGQAEDRTYSTQSSLRKGMDLSRIY